MNGKQDWGLSFGREDDFTFMFKDIKFIEVKGVPSNVVFQVEIPTICSDGFSEIYMAVENIGLNFGIGGGTPYPFRPVTVLCSDTYQDNYDDNGYLARQAPLLSYAICSVPTNTKIVGRPTRQMIKLPPALYYYKLIMPNQTLSKLTFALGYLQISDWSWLFKTELQSLIMTISFAKNTDVNSRPGDIDCKRFINCK